MDFVGGFHLEKKNGKLSFVYYHPIYHPLPPTQSSSSSEKKVINNHPFQGYFLCPTARQNRDAKPHAESYDEESDDAKSDDSDYIFPLISSPEYLSSRSNHSSHAIVPADDAESDDSEDDDYNHVVFPLFRYSTKEFEANGGCKVCNGPNLGTDYYDCILCDKRYHRECVESPLKIKSPYHPDHPLQLYICKSRSWIPIIECLCCERAIDGMTYHCVMCQVFMHPVCAMKPIPFVIDQPKSHDHPLTFFPRQTSLVCNVCGLLRKIYPTYICVICNFVAHTDCMYSPRIIKISRHPHRISYTSSLRSGEWSCGVCRQNIDGDYGAYTCYKCCDYVVHPICALGRNVCDRKDLEGVPEEDDITPDVGPFDMISEGVILHFLHDHHLYFEVSIIYDENKFCQACSLPIFEGNFYSCMECDFILHETCAKSPRKVQHALHPHLLTLKVRSIRDICDIYCNICIRFFDGFAYWCEECNFILDIRCASISEPFDYQNHEHPLYLAMKEEEKHICHVCKRITSKKLNCITCDFIICIQCATIPSRVRYKHDKHFLTLLVGKEVSGKSWCEMCEHDLRYIYKHVNYWCDKCCTTVHFECIFGDEPYLKPGVYVFEEHNLMLIQIVPKSNTFRQLCTFCKIRCQSKIFMKDNIIACSKTCFDLSIDDEIRSTRIQ